MKKKNKFDIFFDGYAQACEWLCRSPFHLAALIFVYLLCAAKDFSTLPIALIGLTFWATGYRHLLLKEEC